MNSQRGLNRGNFRGTDRKSYSNRDQRPNRTVWQETKYQSNGYRDSRSVVRPDARNPTSSSTQLPGIAVYKNPTAKPFEANANATNDGSGDKNGCVTDKEIDAISQNLSDMDLKAKEAKTESTTADSSAGTDHSQALSQHKSDDVQSESKQEQLVNSVVSVPTTSSGGGRQRCYTISSESPYNKSYRYKHDFSAQKSFNSFGHNSYRFQNDPNKKYNKLKARPCVPNSQADFNQHMNPMSHSYGYNAQEPCSGLTHYYLSLPCYPSFNYTPLPNMPTNGVQDMNSDQGLNQKSIDCEQKKPALDRTNTPNDPLPMMHAFGPFIPTQAYPEPPIYYGHLVTWKTDSGLIPYFICDIPNNIAPLQLEVNSNNLPVLPVNCRILVLPGYMGQLPIS